MSCNSTSSLHNVSVFNFQEFSETLNSKGIQYTCDAQQVVFRMPDRSIPIVIRAEDCMPTGGGFADIDPAQIQFFVNHLISQVRRNQTQVAASSVSANAGVARAKADMGETVSSASPMPWGTMCNLMPQAGGRGIKNPWNLCYVNAALAALSACPQFSELIQARSMSCLEHSVISRLSRVFKALNQREKASLKYNDPVIEELSLALVSADCPFPITDYRKMQDSSELVEFILTASGLRFSFLDTMTHRVNLASCIRPIVPKSQSGRDSWISLEDCIERQVVFVNEAPILLPICLTRTLYQHETLQKLEYACRPPLIVQIALQKDGGTQKVSYYLRGIILHHGPAPTSGHYITVVPTTDKMLSPDEFPMIWEERNDGYPTEKLLTEKLFQDIMHNGVCYLYEIGS